MAVIFDDELPTRPDSPTAKPIAHGGIVGFSTRSGSYYEVDFAGKRFRRVRGTKPPTKSTGEDGVWQSFDFFVVSSHWCVAFGWYTGARAGKYVATSPVVEADRDIIKNRSEWFSCGV
jgi:hypothetical protein